MPATAVATSLAAGLAMLATVLARPLPTRAGGGRVPGPAVTLAALAAASVGLVALGAASGHAAALLVIAGGVLIGARRLRRRRRDAREAAVASTRVMEACEAIAAELAAGRPPPVALHDVAGDFPELAPVATAAGLGADVPAVLRELAVVPGRQELRLVAAAWEVGLHSGASLADPLERVAAAVRERGRTARLVAGELAAAEATARIMAALPLVFLVAGSGLGGDPWGFLSGTDIGLGCLAAGLLLSYAGLAWLQRITQHVERSP